MCTVCISYVRSVHFVSVDVSDTCTPCVRLMVELKQPMLQYDVRSLYQLRPECTLCISFYFIIIIIIIIFLI